MSGWHSPRIAGRGSVVDLANQRKGNLLGVLAKYGRLVGLPTRPTWWSRSTAMEGLSYEQSDLLGAVSIGLTRLATGCLIP